MERFNHSAAYFFGFSFTYYVRKAHLRCAVE